jgi:hypothetical protein
MFRIEDTGDICWRRPRGPPGAVEPMMMMMMMNVLTVYDMRKENGERNF